MASYKKPDDQVTKFALYYRKYREEKKSGKITNQNYTPELTKERLINYYRIAVNKAENEFGYVIIQTNTKGIDHICPIYKNAQGYLTVGVSDYELYKVKAEAVKQAGEKITSKNVRSNKVFLLHRLVYVWFIRDIPKGMTVDHIDGNKLNNNPENLQLLSRVDNTLKGDGIITGYGRNQYIKSQADAEHYKALREQREKEVLEHKKSVLERKYGLLVKRRDRIANQMNKLYVKQSGAPYTHRNNKALADKIISDCRTKAKELLPKYEKVCEEIKEIEARLETF